MQKRLKILIIILTVTLLGSNLFFTYKYFSVAKTLEVTVEKQKVNASVLYFTQLFMAKVLRGGEVVSFDDRLQLENAVRALNDKEIFGSWESFTKAKDQAEVQADFYDLFELLLGKISLL
jgi:hypothetical protein